MCISWEYTSSHILLGDLKLLLEDINDKLYPSPKLNKKKVGVYSWKLDMKVPYSQSYAKTQFSCMKMVSYGSNFGLDLIKWLLMMI